MRLNQKLLGIVGLLAIGGTTACGAATAAKAANTTQIASATVEVSPNMAPVGTHVSVRASCSDKSQSATVTSPVFGTLTVAQSNASSTLLTADVVVPSTVQPGTFDVTVSCPSGATATTKLVIVVNNASATAQPTVGPHTGGGFLAGRSDGINAAAPWLAGSAATLLVAATVGAVSVRRRRRAIAATRVTLGQPIGHIDLDASRGEPAEVGPAEANDRGQFDR